MRVRLRSYLITSSAVLSLGPTVGVIDWDQSLLTPYPLTKPNRRGQPVRATPSPVVYVSTLISLLLKHSPG